MAKINAKGKDNGKATGKKSPKDFFAHIIPALRSEGYKGAHLVYSGLGQAIDAYYGFDKADRRAWLDKLAKEGVIVMVPAKGGPTVYLPQDAPKRTDGMSKKVKDALAGL